MSDELRYPQDVTSPTPSQVTNVPRVPTAGAPSGETPPKRQRDATRAAEQTESGATGRTGVAGSVAHDAADSSRGGETPEPR